MSDRQEDGRPYVTFTIAGELVAGLSMADRSRLIGGNDLWIAATALVYRMPVVTRNVRHYRRVPALQVVDYAGHA